MVGTASIFRKLIPGSRREGTGGKGTSEPNRAVQKRNYVRKRPLRIEKSKIFEGC